MRVVLQNLSKTYIQWKKSSQQNQFFSEAGRGIWIPRTQWGGKNNDGKASYRDAGSF